MQCLFLHDSSLSSFVSELMPPGLGTLSRVISDSFLWLHSSLNLALLSKAAFDCLLTIPDACVEPKHLQHWGRNENQYTVES